MRLKEAELRIGYVVTEDVSSRMLPRLSMRLAEVDQLRLESLLRFEDRVAFAVGRLLVRKILTLCSPETLGGWPIEVDEAGKPVLLRSDGIPDLRFNITHCAGLVAVVVALGRDVGIDAEYTDGATDCMDLARVHLPPSEHQFLESLNGKAQRDAFYSLWTLREAYVKALGEGLEASFSKTRFYLDPPRVFEASASEAHPGWYLSHERPTRNHVLAVAARCKPFEQLLCEKEFFDLESLCL